MDANTPARASTGFIHSCFWWVVGVVIGYVLLGRASGLVMKTEGALQAWARQKAEICLFGVLAFMAMVSIWTPMLEPKIAARWFEWPNMLFLAPVPIATILVAWWCWRSLARWRDNQPFFAAMGLFALCYLGLGISTFPWSTPHKITLWEAASAPQSQAFLLLGTLLLVPIILMYTGGPIGCSRKGAGPISGITENAPGPRSLSRLGASGAAPMPNEPERAAQRLDQ